MKQKKKHAVPEQIKAARKLSREEEIKSHGKRISYRNIAVSKKKYNRNTKKADQEDLPFLCYDPFEM